MSPSYYGEEAIPEMGEVDEYRDRYDYDLCMTAIRWQLPILGICRGMQTINIAFGGSLYQDIKAQADGKPFCHSQDADRSVATQTATRPGPLSPAPSSARPPWPCSPFSACGAGRRRAWPGSTSWCPCARGCPPRIR